MTMVPAQNHLSKQHLYGGYVGSCGGVGRFFGSGNGVNYLMNGGGGQVYEYSSTTSVSESEYSCLGSDLHLLLPHQHMAEDESRTNSLNDEPVSRRDEVESWLQLSIGSGNNHDQPDSTVRRSSGLVELDLLSSGEGSRDIATGSTLADRPIFPATQIPVTSRFISPSFFQHRPGSLAGSSNFLQQEINWAFRPIPSHNVTGVAPVPSTSSASVSASSSFLPVGGVSSYFGRPSIQFQGSGGVVDVDEAGPSSKIRIINPPRRPHSGIWFTLKALENQAKEPFLPQISKNYLRIKDGKMTVRLVMKYLVNKLNLDSESEIEIRCRGQHLLPFLTLQHVRDSIWRTSSSSSSSSRDSLFNLLPDSSTTDHLMVLHYGRIDNASN